MKTKSILLLSGLMIAGLSLTTSCNKDDDNATPAPAAGVLAGKWYYSKIGADPGSGSVIYVDYPDNEAGCEKDYIVINTNNTFNDIDFDSTDAPCEMFTDEGTYIVTDNVITLNYGSDIYVGTILSLTTTELKLQESGTGFILVFSK